MSSPYSILCHGWHSTSQSCRQLIGFTQNLGRKFHAVRKIDLGLYSEGKMKDIQPYHFPSRVSVQAFAYSPRVIPENFIHVISTSSPGHKVKGGTRHWLKRAANLLWLWNPCFRMKDDWKKNAAHKCLVNGINQDGCWRFCAKFAKTEKPKQHFTRLSHYLKVILTIITCLCLIREQPIRMNSTETIKGI